MRICIVSPHLDDALLSCGILMQRGKALSNEVYVLNIFSAGENSENRKKEDLRAAQEIGAQAFFLDELDAPDRNPRYKSEMQIFFGAMHHVSEDYIARIQDLITQFLAEHRIDIAYFPLAAGTHIDHRIAFEAGRRVRNAAVKFYEDRPYILWPGILQGRMNEIGSDALLPKVSEQMMLDTLQSFHHLKHFVPQGEYREKCLPLYFAALNMPSSCKLKAECETLVATEEEIKKLYDCLRHYESQMGFIYPNYDRFVKDSHAYERANSGKDIYAERFWTFSA